MLSNQKKISVRVGFPSKFEGSDNQIEIVIEGGFLYLFYRYNGEWYKVKLEKHTG